MEDKIYYIKGSKKNPQEVRQALFEIYPNAEDITRFTFEVDYRYYYVINGHIDYADNNSQIELLKTVGIELQPKKVVKFVEKTMYKCICAGAIRNFYTTQLYSTVDEVMSQSNAIGYEEVKIMVKE